MTTIVTAIIIALCLAGTLAYFTVKAVKDIIEIKNRNRFKF